MSIEASNGRSEIASGMFALWVATHHSPSEMAIVTASLVRARSPSERRLTILV